MVLITGFVRKGIDLSMENIFGYARVLARTRVEQQLNKPFLRKPYLKFGQCYVLWSYFFQLGGILGAKHSANLDAFGHAFLGAQGPCGAVKKFFTELSDLLVKDSVNDTITYSDYIGAEIIKRMGHIGDAHSFLLEQGMMKLRPNTAEELAYQFSEAGAALGAVYPYIMRNMFELTHKTVPKENWERARAVGLNIPPEQELTSYEETEKGENELFMAYCCECCPELYSILSK